MNTTSISWAEKPWNPVTGCTPISEGCANCYAKRMAQRLRGRCGYPEDEPFKVTLHPDRLGEPLRMRKPSRIFVCSMSDLFHEDVPDAFINQVFAVMAMRPEHRFMVLTKRPERMKRYSEAQAQLFPHGMLTASGNIPWPLPNVWLGVTTENQARADERIPILLQVPAAVRFVSCEPLLGPVDIESYLTPPSERICSNCWQYREADHQEAPGTCADLGVSTQPNAAACSGFEDRWADDFESAGEWLGRIDWVICGGETGPGARPMHPEWVRSLRDQCQVSPTPFHFKSWGEWLPGSQECGCDAPPGDYDGPTRLMKHMGNEETVERVGAKYSGSLLDGRTWDERPEVGR